jgi:hypothetical protein
MRTVTLVLAVAVACAASPALPQPRILVVQDRGQAAPAAPAQEQAGPQAAAPLPPVDKASPPPAKAESAATQNESQAKRQDRAMQAPPPPRPLLAPPGRFIFRRVDNGLLRLDRQSGQVTYCSSRGNGWSCAAVPENNASVQKQIDQLRSEVAAVKSDLAALERKVATLRAPPPPPPHPAPPQTEPHPVPPETVPPSASPPDDHAGGPLRLPNHQDIARARGFITDTWHRLVEMIENMQKDLLRNSGNNGNGVSRT